MHLLIQIRPTCGIHFVVNQLKGISSFTPRNEFESLRKRLSTVWTRFYFVESVGYILENTVKRYIENQKYIYYVFIPSI
ncbi:transposase [Sanguibacteroides justesenii]|uniref:transposase n=1 Tax=Sanguibacteroides justesenii TaxID=1547597 RepID=UPI0021D397AD|nr:transposase [Sanguibacteroides justesenii]